MNVFIDRIDEGDIVTVVTGHVPAVTGEVVSVGATLEIVERGLLHIFNPERIIHVRKVAAAGIEDH